MFTKAFKANYIDSLTPTQGMKEKGNLLVHIQNVSLGLMTRFKKKDLQRHLQSFYSCVEKWRKLLTLIKFLH